MQNFCEENNIQSLYIRSYVNNMQTMKQQSVEREHSQYLTRNGSVMEQARKVRKSLMSVKSAGRACDSPSSLLRGASCGCKIDTTLFIRKGDK